MSEYSPKTKVEPFNASNYDDWHNEVKDLLMKRNVWWTISVVKLRPVALDAYAKYRSWTDLEDYLLHWQFANEEAIQIIRNNCDSARKMDVQRLQGTDDATASDVWGGLKDLHQQADAMTWTMIMFEMMLIRSKDGDNHSDLRRKIDKINELQDKLNGMNIDKEDI